MEGSFSVGYPVVHFEVAGKDGAKLNSFYGDLFDWKIDSNNPMNYGIVDTGGQGGINGGIAGGDHGEPRVTFYVAVPDPQATLDEAERLGGRTIMPVSEIPGAGVTLAMLSDPEGNVVGIIKS